MNYKIQLSIAIPVYNGAGNLIKQFKRIFKAFDKKKYKNLIEILISDNNSTDQTKKVVFSYIKKSLKNKNIIISYFKQKKNIGFPKNFAGLPKLANGKYIFYLSDDDLPGIGFYVELINLLKKNYSNSMLIAPIANSNKYYKAFFGINKISYIVNRGSIFSGIILNRKLIKYSSFEKTLYPQTELFLDYYLKYGMKDLEIKSIIKNLDINKDFKKFTTDRMQRDYDWAMMGKIKIIEKFYKNYKINFLELLYSVYSIYKWGLDLKMILRNKKIFWLEKLFFKEIIKYKRKKLLNFILFILFLKKIFSKNRSFYYEALKIKLLG